MNKILFWFKNILICLLLFLITRFIMVFEYGDMFFIFYLFLVFIFTITSIKDIVYKNHDKMYTILSIITLLIMDFIFIRTLYDPNFIYNKNLDLLDIKIYNILYLCQNTIYFIIMLSLLLIYRKINIKNDKNILNNSYVIMILAGLFSIPSLFLIFVYLFTGGFIIFGSDFTILYLIINLFLMGYEVFRVISGKYKNKIWIFVISILFHLVSLIMIYISMIIHK